MEFPIAAHLSLVLRFVDVPHNTDNSSHHRNIVSRMSFRCLSSLSLGRPIISGDTDPNPTLIDHPPVMINPPKVFIVFLVVIS